MTTRMLRGRRLSALGLGGALALSASLAAAQNGDAAALSPSGLGQSCGAVVVAEFEWPAAEITAHVMERALRDGYGCLAVRRRADTEQTLTAIEESGGGGDQDQVGQRVIAPGVRLAKFAETDTPPTVVGLGAALYGEGDFQGLFIPAWLAAEHPELRQLADLPAFGRKMAADGIRPTLRLCPATWECAEEARAVAEQLKLAQWFELETPLSGEALVSAIQAARQAPTADRTPWISYFWAPSLWVAEARLWPLRVGELAYCPSDAACRPAFTRPPQRIAYAQALIQKTPRLLPFLNKFNIPAKIMTEALNWRALNNADAPTTVGRLIANNRPLWTEWFDPQALEAFQGASRVITGPPPN